MEQEQQYTYRYFFNGVFPIRAIVASEDGDDIIGTETPNRDTGVMELNQRFLDQVIWNMSGDIDEIPKEEFDQRVKEFVEKSNLKPEI